MPTKTCVDQCRISGATGAPFVCQWPRRAHSFPCFFDISQLTHFINRVKKFNALHQAEVKTFNRESRKSKCLSFREEHEGDLEGKFLSFTPHILCPAPPESANVHGASSFPFHLATFS